MNEQALAARLGVSRDPIVRSAELAVLQVGRGQTESRDFCRTLSRKEAVRVCHVRAAVIDNEGIALATGISASQMQKLDALVDAMDAVGDSADLATSALSIWNFTIRFCNWPEISACAGCTEICCESRLAFTTMRNYVRFGMQRIPDADSATNSR